MDATLEDILRTFGKAESAGKQQSGAEIEMKRNEEQLDPIQGSSSDSSAIFGVDETRSMPFQQPSFFGNSYTFDPTSETFWEEVFPILGRNLNYGSTANLSVVPSTSSAVGTSPPPPSSPSLFKYPPQFQAASTTQASYHRPSAASFSDDDDDNDVQEMSTMLSDEKRRASIEVQQFAQYFREKRLQLGLSQLEVSAALEKRYGVPFGSSTISRFERLFYSKKATCEMRPRLEEWLNELINSIEAGADLDELVQQKTRRASTSVALQENPQQKKLSLRHRNYLREIFEENPHPDKKKLIELAGKLGLGVRNVRTWFYNQRHKRKRSINAQSDSASLHLQLSPNEESQEINE